MPLLVSVLRACALFVVFCLFCFAVLGFAANGVRAAPALYLVADGVPPPAVAGEPAMTEAEFAATPAAPAAPSAVLVRGVDVSGPADTIVNAVGMLLASVLTAVLAWIGRGVVGLLSSKQTSEQAKAKADEIRARIDDVSHDIKMNDLATTVTKELIGAALSMSGLKLEDLKDLKIRNPTLRLAAKLGADQWADLWKWVDQDENGQIDWLESKLAGVIPPVDQVARTTPAAAA